MNNRQKIVVSIVGIFIVILALIGITYAYFLTRISGNTNTKSIEVTTADLALVYADGNGIINNGGNKLMPGNSVGTKTFTVTNTGEDEIEDYIVYLEDVVNPLGRPQDLVYTITCSQVNATSGEVTGTCNGVSDETVYPKGNSVLLTNDIASGLRHEYTFTLNYLNPNENQTEDMNKTFSGKINIYDAKGLNPYSENTNTLAYNIINNSISATNETQLRSVPLTIPAVEINNADEKDLSIANDDYGTSFYYRGDVEDNYVNFAGMCWRIVRIEGDGSTKLILEDSTYECNSASYTGNWTINEDVIVYGVDNTGKADFLNYTGGLADNLSTYQSTLTTKISSTYTGKTITDYLKVDEWCFDNSVTSTSGWGYDDNYNTVYTESKATNGWFTDETYGASTRLYTDKKPSLKCSGTKLTSFKDNTPMYVGTLTADEVAYAGALFEIDNNNNNYLLNSYVKTNFIYWWTLSPFTSGYACSLYPDGDLRQYNVEGGDGGVARGSVTLKSNVEILTGDGTKQSPYVLQ